jgi:hypothetical protein
MAHGTISRTSRNFSASLSLLVLLAGCGKSVPPDIEAEAPVVRLDEPQPEPVEEKVTEPEEDRPVVYKDEEPPVEAKVAVEDVASPDVAEVVEDVPPAAAATPVAPEPKAEKMVRLKAKRMSKSKSRFAKRGYDMDTFHEQRVTVQAQAKQVEALSSDIEDIRAKLKMRKLRGLRDLARRSGWNMRTPPSDNPSARKAWEAWVELEKEVGSKLP